MFMVALNLCSCNQDTIKSYENQITILQFEKDSLQKIVDEVSKKYIFDSITIYNRPSPENTNKIGNDYRMDFIVSAFNKSDFFIKYDTIIDNKMINPDTIDYESGRYQYKSELYKNGQLIKIKMQTGDKRHGNYKQGTLYDKIRVKE